MCVCAFSHQGACPGTPQDSGSVASLAKLQAATTSSVIREKSLLRLLTLPRWMGSAEEQTHKPFTLTPVTCRHQSPANSSAFISSNLPGGQLEKLASLLTNITALYPWPTNDITLQTNDITYKAGTLIQSN